jgi:7,8-dihydropterin-6-yl-methyl-4-(beta-D-ribofuranosyl)aminobenzene 5'-phosphate synthase
MEIKITTLNENSATGGVLAEWGLSMFVEVDGMKVLFDTGAGAAVPHNARLMGVDLGGVDAIVLSHGHHDHTGGLRQVLRLVGSEEVPVIAHPDIWGRKYGSFGGGPKRFNGIPFVREGLESLGASFRLSREPVKLSAGVMTTGEIPMVTDYEFVEDYLYIMEGDRTVQDPMADDLALVIDAEYGLVVILGCGHRGIVNTLRRARELTGKELIYAAIGGTHLVHASAERLERTAADLLEMGVQYLGVSHCTGFNASAYLAGRFGERFFQNNSGTRLTLPFEE